MSGRHPDTRTFQRHEDPLIRPKPAPRPPLDPALEKMLRARRDALYMEARAIEELLGIEPPPRRARANP
jgi:hypothetical protein